MQIFTIILLNFLCGPGWLLLISIGAVVVAYGKYQKQHGAIDSAALCTALTVVGLVMAWLVLLLHLASMPNFPYMVRMYEMRWPVERAAVNIVIQMVQAGILYLWLNWLPAPLRLPPLWIIGALALAAVMGSASFHIVYNTSLCCENPLATWWGFPFSWLYGIAQDPPFARYTEWTAPGYVLHFAGQMRWRINWWKLAADLLFWWNVLFLGWTMWIVVRESLRVAGKVTG
ncbi:MAG: hypothetical protein R3A44_16890 [Caldilineaceae bacterium]